MNVVTCNTKTKTPPASRESRNLSETISEQGYSPWARRPSTFVEEGSIIIPHGEILLADGQTKKADKMVPKHAWAKSSDGEI